MLKHIEKLYTFILMQLFKFFFPLYWAILFFMKNVGVKIIGNPNDSFK